MDYDRGRVFPVISAPSNVDIELTTVCNARCRHCYNFWRHDDHGNTVMSIEQADLIIEQLDRAGVFHAVLTGGECLTNYKVLTHFMRELASRGISFSMNSNLFLASREKMEELAGLGLPHLLASLNSHLPAVNDKMVSHKGAWRKILNGIEHAVAAGIKVSANMIVTQLNKAHVYETGKLLSELGAANFFTTRMVPCTSAGPELERELQLSPREERELVLDQAIAVKDDCGINIGSLIQYPVCFLQDVEKYRDYVGRGCPAGRKMLCINADGNTQACLHENQGYGNVFTDGLVECWRRMRMWADDSLLPAVCRSCDWLRFCEGACRVYTDSLDGMDKLAGDSRPLPPAGLVMEPYLQLACEKSFIVPERLRWRREQGFWLVNTRGASTYDLPIEQAEFLRARQGGGPGFTRDEFPGPDEQLAFLIKAWVLEADDGSLPEPV